MLIIIIIMSGEQPMARYILKKFNPDDRAKTKIRLIRLNERIIVNRFNNNLALTQNSEKLYGKENKNPGIPCAEISLFLNQYINKKCQIAYLIFSSFVLRNEIKVKRLVYKFMIILYIAFQPQFFSCITFRNKPWCVYVSMHDVESSV